MLRSPVLLLLSLVSFVCTAVALFNDDAFVIDWHKPAIGSLTPSRLLLSPTSLTALSDSAILAAIDPLSGDFLWRHSLTHSAIAQDAVLTRLDDSSVLVAAASPTDPAITHIAVFVELNGGLLWESNLAIGAPISVTVGSRDAFVLASDGVLVRLRHLSGRLSWQYQLPTGYSPVAASYVESLSAIAIVVRSQQSGLGYITVDINSGESTSDFIRLDTLPAAVGVTVVSSDLLAWTLPAAPDSIKLGSLFDGSSKGVISASKSYSSYELSAHGNTLTATFVSSDGKSGWVQVYKLNPSLELIKTSEVSATASIYASSGSDELFEFQDATFGGFSLSDPLVRLFGPTDVEDLPSLSSIEFVKCSSSACLVGDIYSEYTYVNSTGKVWARDESTVGATASLFVDLEEEGEESAIGDVLFEEHASPVEAYVHRLSRHIRALNDLPAYLVSFVKRFISGNYDAAPETYSGSVTIGDTFGFRKLIILATPRGGLRALDTANGGARVWKVDNVLSGEPIVGLALEDRGAAGKSIKVIGSFGKVATVSVTGTVVEISKLDRLGLGDKIEKIVSLPPAGEDEQETLAVWTAHGEFLVVGTEPSKPLFLSKVVDNTVKGYIYEKGSVTETYTFSLPTANYKISSVSARDPKDVSVSIGRVLGDRSVLYKYLNPHLLAVTAVDPSTSSAAVFLLDSASGRLLYSGFHDGEVVDTDAGVKVVMGENWVVYSYWSEKVARGEKLVVLDLYESDIKDERWSKSLGNFSSFVNTPAPYVQSQAYLFPNHITTLAVTRSRFGITNRDIIAALDTNMIVELPKRLLDARRPVNRDPSNEEKEEGLMRYEPLIIDDRRSVISHVRQVIGTQVVECAPALLESTVLVFSHGVDLFFTRVTPSQPFDVLSKSFNKGQLVTTILALGVGVRLVGPMVRRKQIKARWGSS
ncbi:hypothetical protein BZA70DRAFT_248339 [Myxozyma melibiosi]|uniref:ER membrane protein complex subunit 1 n=1 Tax=Myxozyma melibiosi TaxID=54550 RepID=A0ABR1F5M2_9ASCO